MKVGERLNKHTVTSAHHLTILDILGQLWFQAVKLIVL